MLLERGANANKLDINLSSPLAVACGTGGEKCIDLLIRHGAIVD